jgi:hypothetical protein
MATILCKPEAQIVVDTQTHKPEAQLVVDTQTHKPEAQLVVDTQTHKPAGCPTFIRLMLFFDCVQKT